MPKLFTMSEDAFQSIIRESEDDQIVQPALLRRKMRRLIKEIKAQQKVTEKAA
jgi:hypothetical protein